MMNIFIVIVYNYYATTKCISSHHSREEAIEACVKYHKATIGEKRTFSSEPEVVEIPNLREILTKDGRYSFYQEELDRQDRWGVKSQRLFKIYFIKEIKGYITDNFLLVQDKLQPLNLECFACSSREKALDIVTKKLNKPHQKIKERFTGNYYSKDGINFFIEPKVN